MGTNNLDRIERDMATPFLIARATILMYQRASNELQT